MATDNLQCVFVFLLFQMVLIYHWISSWLSVCFMYEGYSGAKQRQNGSKSLIFGKYQNITTLQHFALKKTFPTLMQQMVFRKFNKHFLGENRLPSQLQTHMSYYVVTVKERNFSKFNLETFATKLFVIWEMILTT